jgi:hypothetical protein
MYMQSPSENPWQNLGVSEPTRPIEAILDRSKARKGCGRNPTTLPVPPPVDTPAHIPATPRVIIFRDKPEQIALTIIGSDGPAIPTLAMPDITDTVIACGIVTTGPAAVTTPTPETPTILPLTKPGVIM